MLGSYKRMGCQLHEEIVRFDGFQVNPKIKGFSLTLTPKSLLFNALFALSMFTPFDSH
jgi:hypothetical protein